MLFNQNFFIHAVAGSGKTTRLVKLALREKSKKILITTYTNKNTDEIKNKIISINGFIPNNIEIKSWFSFLLSDCVRPYQKVMGFDNRISDMFFSTTNPHCHKLPNGKIITTVKRTETKKYYTNTNNKIYSCYLSEFAYFCNEKSQNAVIKRLEECYDYIFIDEAQDFSGYDFKITDLLLNSNCKIIIVGDKRQNLFDTQKSRTNKKYAENLHLYFSDKQQQNKGILKEMVICWRCNEEICTFADKIHTDLENSCSRNLEDVRHKGIYCIKESNVNNYIEEYSPAILTWNQKHKMAKQHKTLNIGASKGLTFDRVLICPTKNILNYIKHGQTISSLEVKNKLYVAITRAKHSVAFLIPNQDNPSSYALKEIQEWGYSLN